jgi:predicted phosphodiesterase
MNRRGFLKRIAACGGLAATPGIAGAAGPFFRVRIALPENGPFQPVSFGLVTDTHYGDFDDTDRPRFFRASLPNLAETVQMFNAEGIDFAAYLGDVIQESGNRQTSIAWLRAMDGEFRKFNGPIHYMAGNHDLGDLSKDDFIANTSGAFKAPDSFFDRAGFRFIFMDANYRQDGVAYDRGNFSWTDSYVPARQVNWLSKTLDRAKVAGLKAIIFTHQTLDHVSADHRIQNAAELRALFASKGNVVAVFYGHRHAGGYYNFNGIHYIGLVATVNGPDAASAIVRISPNGILEVDGRGARQRNWGPFSFSVS